MADLKLLIIEDSEDDAVLIGHVLRQAGHTLEMRRVEHLDELEAALDEPWDVILADFNLPGFSGMDALELARARAPEVPFIIVSGAIGEEMAATLMRAGARDFVGKSNLARLAPAIQRELRETAARRAHALADEERQASEKREAEALAQVQVAQDLDRMKTLLLHTISHELRNPLTSVVGYLELLDRETVGPLVPTQHEFLGHALHGAHRIQHLIDDLLDYARVQGGLFQIRRERTDLAAVVREVVADLRPQADSAGVRLRVRAPEGAIPADLDARRMAQVLSNLVNNAIKFSPKGGAVVLRVEADDRTVAVEVVDEGPGIAPADRPKLFHLFTQLEDGLRKGGTGLGLAIAKRIVEAHGGEIGLRDAPRPARTTFFVRLPRYQQPPADAFAPSPA